VGVLLDSQGRVVFDDGGRIQAVPNGLDPSLCDCCAAEAPELVALAYPCSCNLGATSPRFVDWTRFGVVGGWLQEGGLCYRVQPTGETVARVYDPAIHDPLLGGTSFDSCAACCGYEVAGCCAAFVDPPSPRCWWDLDPVPGVRYVQTVRFSGAIVNAGTYPCGAGVGDGAESFSLSGDFASLEPEANEIGPFAPGGGSTCATRNSYSAPTTGDLDSVTICPDGQGVFQNNRLYLRLSAFFDVNTTPGIDSRYVARIRGFPGNNPNEWRTSGSCSTSRTFAFSSTQTTEVGDGGSWTATGAFAVLADFDPLPCEGSGAIGANRSPAYVIDPRTGVLTPGRRCRRCGTDFAPGVAPVERPQETAPPAGPIVAPTIEEARRVAAERAELNRRAGAGRRRSPRGPRRRGGCGGCGGLPVDRGSW
jgi:hypothetical protein